MAWRKVFDNERLAPDEKTVIRYVSFPGGTYFGEQTLADTPQKRNMAWQHAVPVGSTAGEAAELRNANGQSYRNARKKSKGTDKSEEAARESLPVALLAGFHRGPLGVGPERVKAQRALSQEVRRAEQSVEDRDAQNERRKDHRAELSVENLDALSALQIDRRAGQSVDVRDAINARRRANEQVR
jgi:hypothetical protein